MIFWFVDCCMFESKFLLYQISKQLLLKIGTSELVATDNLIVYNVFV